MANIMAPSCPIGLKGSHRGGLTDLEWSERGPATRFEGLAMQGPSSPLDVTSALYALPCRIAGRPAQGPPPRNITLPQARPLHASHARHFVPYQQSEYEVNRRSRAWAECCTSKACVPNLRFGRFLDLLQKSLILDDESLITHKISLFAKVGILLLSLRSFDQKPGPDSPNR